MKLTADAARPHAKPFSLSQYERAKNCTKSIELTQAGCTPRVASQDSVRGTASHMVLEWCLRNGGEPTQIAVVLVEGVEVNLADEDRAAVRVALNWIREHLADRKLLIEQRIDLPWSRLFGWADVVTADAPLVVLDYKHGFNAVAADCAQLKLYALGRALTVHGSIEGDGSVDTVIIQPRALANPIRSHRWSYADLRDQRDELIELLDRLRRRDFTYTDGPWCRWCPVAGSCPRLAAVARDAIAAELVAPELLAAGEWSAQALNDALLMVPALEHWARQVNEIGMKYLEGGGRLEAFKLVEKRSGARTVASRDDPRPEVDVGKRLHAALRSSVAFEYSNAARSNG